MTYIVTDLSKRISYNYFIKNTYESGIVLFGWEVKCIKFNGIDLSNSFAFIKKQSIIFLKGSVVNYSNFVFNYIDKDVSRDRVLLLNKKEILNLVEFLSIKGYTLIPSKAYWKKCFLKIELCLCLGKKKYDKRKSLKDKEVNMDLKKYLL